MTKIKILLSLIGKKALAKYLPQILAWIFSKVFTFILERYPAQSAKVVETCDDLTRAVGVTINAVRDGKVDTKELEDIKFRWLEVFK